MKIKDVMNQEVISVNEQTSPIEAFEKKCIKMELEDFSL